MAKKHIIGLAVLSVLAIGGSALADEPETKNPPLGTPQEYKACLDLQDALKVRRLALDQRISENNNTVVLLQVQARELVKTQKKLVLSDEVQVHDFNDLTEEHNRRIVAAEKVTERVKREHELFSNDTLEYNRKCATLVMSVNVRDAVVNERDGAANESTTAAPSALSASSAPSVGE
uniref:Uncharacterized protein n=1 Tax=Geobacter sp. (strain M21) TaxID=443144 RepID=C6E5R9_GEOSM